MIEVYSGVVEPAYVQEKNFSMELEKLYKGVQPDAAWLPKVIHIDHALSDKEFDVAAIDNMERETARLKKHREKLRKQKRDAMKNVYGS